MTPALLVAVSHGLDLLTFMLAVERWGIAGEANSLMQMAYLSGGLALVVTLKASGALALSCIAHLRRWALLPAAGAGIAGATINLIAITL